MPVRGPMLLHRMALVSFRLFCKNLGNLQEFFGQMVYRPPLAENCPYAYGRSAVFLPYRSYFTVMETSEHEKSRGRGGTRIKVKRRIGDNECQRVVCGWTVW